MKALELRRSGACPPLEGKQSVMQNVVCEVEMCYMPPELIYIQTIQFIDGFESVK